MDAAGRPVRNTDRAATRWALWVRGRVRTSVVIGDERGEHLAELQLKGWPRKRRRVLAVDDEERSWVAVVRPGSVTVECDGHRRLTADEATLVVDDQRLDWPVADDGTERRAVRRPDDGEVLLRMARPDDDADEGASVLLDLHHDLPSRFVVVLAVCAVHLSVHGTGGWLDALDPAVVLDAVGGV